MRDRQCKTYKSFPQTHVYPVFLICLSILIKTFFSVSANRSESDLIGYGAFCLYKQFSIARTLISDIHISKNIVGTKIVFLFTFHILISQTNGITKESF